MTTSIALELHGWRGIGRHHDLFMGFLTLGFVTLGASRGLLHEKMAALRAQLAKARDKIT